MRQLQKKTSGEDSEYSCWNDENYAVDEATDNEWIDYNGNHYCPDCYKIDADENVIITEKKDDNK